MPTRATKEHRQRWAEKNRERYRELLRNARKRLTEKNDEFIAQYKRDHPCMRCGITDPRVLEFHHRNPADKRYNVSQMRTNFKLEKLKAELDKCDVYCRNCHAILHWEERNGMNEDEIDDSFDLSLEYETPGNAGDFHVEEQAQWDDQ